MGLRYTIRAVSAKTGLSVHTIRAWERRYGALEPDRSDTNRRLYGAEEVERLSLLKGAVDAGHSIGQVALLPADQLRGLKETTNVSVQPAHIHDAEACLKACVTAMEQFDAAALEDAVVRSAALLGVNGLLEDVVLPFIQLIDRRWQEGSLRIAHEHLASAVLRTCLERIRLSISASVGSPKLLVTTPTGQHHELGALIVAIVGALQGWHVTYLGPNLPADEIANAARQSGVQAVALSIVYPVDDPALGGEMAHLRKLVGEGMPILVGGRASATYSGDLQQASIEQVQSIGALRSRLDEISSGG